MPPAQGESASSPPRHSHGPALAKDIPSPCFLLCLNKHRICRTGPWGAGRGRPWRPETVLAIHPAPSCPVAPNCFFVKGPVCKLGSLYKGTESACHLKIHTSGLTRSQGGQHRLRLWFTFLPKLSSLSRIHQPRSPDANGWD